MNKAKVLFFEGNQKVAFGGGQRVSLGVLESLAGLYQIHLALTGKSPIFESRARSHLTGQISLPIFTSAIKKSKAGTNVSLLEVLFNLACFPINILKLLSYLNHNNMSSRDTLIYSATKYGHFYAFVLMLFGYKTIAHIHTMDKASSLTYRVLSFIYRNMTATISVSNSVCTHFQISSSKIIYNFIEPPIGSFSPDKVFHSPLRLGMLTSLHPSKGIEFVAKIVETFDDCELHVGGDGPLKNQLHFKNLHLHGFIDQIDKFFNEVVDVLIVPTLIPEAFGLVIAEASARGIPAFCSNLGGQKEVQKLLGVPERTFGILDDHEVRSIIQDLLKRPMVFSQGTKIAFARANQLFSKNRFQQEIQGLFDSLE